MAAGFGGKVKKMNTPSENGLIKIYPAFGIRA
jgi:hypothetical protein